MKVITLYWEEMLNLEERHGGGGVGGQNSTQEFKGNLKTTDKHGFTKKIYKKLLDISFLILVLSSVWFCRLESHQIKLVVILELNGSIKKG